MRIRIPHPLAAFGYGLMTAMLILITGTVFGSWEIEWPLRACVAAVNVVGCAFVLIGQFALSHKSKQPETKQDNVREGPLEVA
jgi:hypothetical protein